MRRFMMIVGGTALVLGSSLVAVGQDKAQAPKQAPMQAPVQAPAKPVPMQAPTQKMVPVQSPKQAPVQSPKQCPTQSPIQKGGKLVSAYDLPENDALAARPGWFRRR